MLCPSALLTLWWMCQQWQTQGRALRHETCHFDYPEVRQCPVSVGNAMWCCFWCTGFMPAGASSARCAVQTAQVGGGSHPKGPHLALLPANTSTEWTPDSLVTALLCDLLNKETVFHSQVIYQFVLPTLVRELEAVGKGRLSLLFVDSGN